MENELDTQQSLNAEGEQDASILEDTDEVQNQEIRYQKAKAKAEEAEAKLKQLREELTQVERQVPPKKEEKKELPFSIKDFKALSDVHDDDVDEVVEYAQFKGITIAEAKKSPIVRNLLKEKEEIRQTAQATNVGPAKRGIQKNTDEYLLEQLDKGELPEESIEQAVKARLERLAKKK